MAFPITRSLARSQSLRALLSAGCLAIVLGSVGCERDGTAVLLTVSGSVRDEHDQPVSLREGFGAHRAEFCYRAYYRTGSPDQGCEDVTVRNGRFTTQIRADALGREVLGTETWLTVRWTEPCFKCYVRKHKRVEGRVVPACDRPANTTADVLVEFTLPTWFEAAGETDE